VAAADEALYAAKAAGKNRVYPLPARAAGRSEPRPERRKPKQAASKRKPAARKPRTAEGEI
jgi:hypothetical protein